jgi:hypothetical protein
MYKEVFLNFSGLTCVVIPNISVDKHCEQLSVIPSNFYRVINDWFFLTKCIHYGGE